MKVTIKNWTKLEGMAANRLIEKIARWWSSPQPQKGMEQEAKAGSSPSPQKEIVSSLKTKRSKDGGPLVLFVHGLAGSPESTWALMLRALASDPALASFGYDCYSFPTGLWRPPLGTRMPSIQELAEGLRTHIDVHYSNATKIYIVAHSLGGVVARQLILDCRKSNFHFPFAGVMLIAAPHGGASLAALGQYLSADHKHLAQLSEQSDIIDLIGRDWVRLKIEESLQTVYVVGGIDAVVASTSAAPYAGQRNVLTLIGYGHRDILEPIDTLDTRYKIVQNFLLGVNIQSEKLPTQIPIPSEPADPLFDQYSNGIEVFYYRRQHDQALALVGGGRAAWLTGPSGSGKTVALFRKALQSGCTGHNISLDTLSGLSAHALLCEICSSITERAGKGIRFPHDTPVLTLDNELKKAIPSIGNRVAVIVEEVPLSEGRDLSLFATTLAKFFQINRNGNQGWEVVWLVSSLGDPRRELGPQTGKVLDTIEVIPIEMWSSEALCNLIDLITPCLEIQISKDDKQYLVEAAKGSPRFLKVALRQKRGQPYRSLYDLVEALRIEWRQ